MLSEVNFAHGPPTGEKPSFLGRKLAILNNDSHHNSAQGMVFRPLMLSLRLSVLVYLRTKTMVNSLLRTSPLDACFGGVSLLLLGAQERWHPQGSLNANWTNIERKYEVQSNIMQSIFGNGRSHFGSRPFASLRRALHDNLLGRVLLRQQILGLQFLRRLLILGRLCWLHRGL